MLPSRWVWAVGLAAALSMVGRPRIAEGQTMGMEDSPVFVYASFDELEFRPGPEERPLAFDATAWIGGDFNRIWLEAQGERPTRGGGGRVEGQLLYGRVVSPFWDLRVGARLDVLSGGGGRDARGLIAVGLQGLAPHWFEVESTVFVSQDGDVSARLQAALDLLLTQRLVLEPEVEVDLAAQDVPLFDVAKGVSGLELGARVRYEIVREFAPYVGVVWERHSHPTAPAEGEASFVAGLRWWY